MHQAIVEWLRRHRAYLRAGIGLWLVLDAAGWAWATRVGTSPLQTVVTWDEWAAAILLLPVLGTLAGAGASRLSHGPGTHRRAGYLSRVWIVGLVVFVLDLALRATCGLGWEPFL